jgi:hypothetical protein
VIYRLTILCLLITIASGSHVAAQSPQITVGQSVHISASHATDVFFETLLAINPRNPRNLIASSIVCREAAFWCDVYASFDSGQTWVQGRGPEGDEQMFRGGDPVVFFDASGAAFFVRTGREDLLKGILSRSTDGGRTWQRYSETVPNGDRPFWTSDQTEGKFHGRMYAALNRIGVDVQSVDGTDGRSVGLWVSTDGGRTFNPTAALVRSNNDEQTFSPGNLLVMPDGKLVVPFQTFRRLEDSSSEYPFSNDGHIGVAVSKDGGITFSSVHLGPPKNYGLSFLPSGARWVHWQAAGIVAAAVDSSAGPFRGRLYFTWADYDEARHSAVVRVAYSTDLGKTWSKPVIIDNNTVEGGASNPAIAVNKDGVVGITWNDFRNDPTGECYQLSFSASTDGGSTFLPNVSVPASQTCPKDLGNWNSFLGSTRLSSVGTPLQERRKIILEALGPTRFRQGGETQGLVADNDGVFHSAWINGASGTMQLSAQRFTVAKLPSVIDSTRADLTPQIELTISKPSIDAAARTLSVTVQLKNTSTAPITGPLSVVLDAIHSDLGELRARNSDNKLSGRGASWNFVSENPPPLLPGQTSPARVFTWTFTWVGKSSLPILSSRIGASALEASFVILGPPK